MFQVIPVSSFDSIPFYFQRNSTVSQPSVPLSLKFSSQDIITTDSIGLDFKKNIYTCTIKPKPLGKTGLTKTFSQQESSIFFLLFVLCFFIFSLFFKSAGKLFIDKFKNLFKFRNSNSSVYKEQVTTTEAWAEMFLIFQTIIITAIAAFIFLYSNEIAELPILKKGVLFIFLVIFFSLFLLIKYIIYLFCGNIFFPSEAKDFIEKYITILESSGVLCFIPAIFYIFVNQLKLIALITLIVIFLIDRLIIITSLFVIFVKNKIGFIYFIVYLCGVEILPYFLLYEGSISMMKIIRNIIVL